MPKYKSSNAVNEAEHWQHCGVRQQLLTNVSLFNHLTPDGISRKPRVFDKGAGVDAVHQRAPKGPDEVMDRE